ncbi:hypothetical protein SAMD00019534_101750 [Acytostelium subglobosum LB1]|uniref:hypothetical protein n=1 Tax=Acytostelium subglobosum LB1 TaxID=1410327 RepID=UPI0006450C08|nr:hypothetical protein SAMD00019534_101750 [Acytostelium subglobosum LB1]GAM27000.1 hypothetical protein SAMD00019534_101750 [Acytostelium subglobosum LB1]|eukprot:XP_012749880.1 hypothetical protein SAMD00019534_101750 [Acytostelium subglobosum LB1]
MSSNTLTKRSNTSPSSSSSSSSSLVAEQSDSISITNTEKMATTSSNISTSTPAKPVSRWYGWWIRFASTVAMFATSISVIYAGHLVTSAVIFLSNVIVYKEISTLSRLQTHKVQLSWFSRALNWYFFLGANYFMIGRIFYGHFANYFHTTDNEVLSFLSYYHILISFIMYIVGFVLFVMTLEVGKYKQQFIQLAWTHMTIISTAAQTTLWISNIFQGFIWFILPTSLVILNDIFAYVFGFFFGKTQLIAVSPKKTWEGFIGGMFTTLIGSILLAHYFSGYSWMICPKTDLILHPTTCVPSAMFTRTTTPVFKWLVPYMFGIESLPVSPIILHAFVLGLFASLVAPYGGFFASGLKRAFGIKDFGSSIPGHGGITDRTDCQFFMGTFTYIYLYTFISRLPAVATILQRVSSLSPKDQLDIYMKLQSTLLESGLLVN